MPKQKPKQKEKPAKKSDTGKGGPDARKVGASYTAQQITVLEGLDPVRKRPGMYIGTTGSPGLHHLVNEVTDNGTDEAMAGYAKRITIRLLPDDHVQVVDDGRGIPVDPHPQFKTSALELVMTKLHAGGKFGGGGYKVSGGLHGVGVSVVNALSTWLKAEVKREGQLWVQEYQRGVPKAKVKAVGRSPSAGTGTAVTFHPDPIIFTEGIRFDRQTILDHIRQQAYLTKGVTYLVEDLREEPELGKRLLAGAFDPKVALAITPLRTYTFHFEGGIASFVRHLNQRKEPAHDAVCYVDKESDGIQVEVALQYVKDVRENVLAFANNIVNPEGGTHIQGFRTALTRTLNAYARAKGYLKEKDENLSGEDAREGLTAVVSVKVKDPQFEGQTKAKLGNPEAQAAVATVFGDAFAAFLEEHPRNAEAIIARCLLTAQARAAAKAARETVLRKGTLEGLTLPGKLADCSSRDPKASEIFIVEGDSAGGSCKTGRNREFQAILPLKGKILNVERARLDKMLANNEIKSFIIALGTNIGEQFEIAKLRYDRIILATDADVDGSHIRTLLLTLLWRYFQQLITEGHVYIAQPPLFRVQVGKEVRYAYSDEERDRVLQELQQGSRAAGQQGKPTAKRALLPSGSAALLPDEERDRVLQELQQGSRAAGRQGKPTAKRALLPSGSAALLPDVVKASIQRYKGLGEMNPEQLWETTMDPARRVLKRVTVDDAQKADAIFDVLMGSDVEPRKKFIQTHAKTVRNLDI